MLRLIMTVLESTYEPWYSRFWTPYLTISFVNYIIYMSCIAYAVIYVDAVPAAINVIFCIFVLEVGLLVYFIIHQCAKVVKCNGAILSENRVFYQQFQMYFHCANLVVKTRALLKAESLFVPRLLHHYAFHLFGNYRITSKSFHVIFSYVGVLFFWVIKNQKSSKQQLQATVNLENLL